MIGRIFLLLRRVLDFYLEPANAGAPASPPQQSPSGGRKPLNRDSKPYLEWTIEDWMEDPWDRRDVEWMRERWPGISDELIIANLRMK